MKHVIAAFTFYVASCSAIAAAPDYEFEHAAPGCVAKADMEEILQMMIEGDSQAWSQTLAKQMMRGKCGQFEKGDKVYVQETAMFKGLIKVRQQGNSTSLWVPSSSVIPRKK